MRPEGCQETGPAGWNRGTIPQPTHSKPFLVSILLTLLKTGSYTGSVTPPLRTVFVSLVVALASAAPGLAQAQHRGLYVTVVDADGQPVTSLGPSDFIVREDNVAREVLTVAPADAPLQIAVLVDNSAAAANDIQNLRKALETFGAALTTPTETGRKNELALITLGERPTLQADYTSDRAAFEKGIGRVFAQPDSGNYLLEGIIEAAHGIMKRNVQRPVIVAVTTEGPEFSSRHHDLVLEPLKESGAAFYVFVVGPPSGSISTSARERGIVLDQGTRDSGGRRETILSSMSLDVALKTLAAQLTHTLLVTYARPETLIPPEHTTVDVKRAGLSAHGTPVKPENAGHPQP